MPAKCRREKSPVFRPSEIETIRRWIAAGAKMESAAEAQQVNQHDIGPIILRRCTACHGARRKEAGLDLRTKASMLKGGKSGPAIVLGKPDESLLVKRVRAHQMPPPTRLVEASVKPMETTELEVIVRWIAAGAPEVNIAPDVATHFARSACQRQGPQFLGISLAEMPTDSNCESRTTAVAQSDRCVYPAKARSQRPDASLRRPIGPRCFAGRRSI